MRMNAATVDRTSATIVCVSLAALRWALSNDMLRGWRPIFERAAEAHSPGLRNIAASKPRRKPTSCARSAGGLRCPRRRRAHRRPRREGRGAVCRPQAVASSTFPQDALRIGMLAITVLGAFIDDRSRIRPGECPSRYSPGLCYALSSATGLPARRCRRSIA